MRWTDVPGSPEGRVRVFLHGLGSAGFPAFGAAVARPALHGTRSLLVDLLGFGSSDHPAAFDYTVTSHAHTVARVISETVAAPVDLVGHSMGGSIAVTLAAAYPQLVHSLVVVDPNLDAGSPTPGAGDSRGIAAYSERRWVDAPEDELRDLLGARWWATMRRADRTGAHRSAVSLVRGGTPSWRTQLASGTLPRTLLHPADDGPYPGGAELDSAGVSVVPVPDCGHDIMADNPAGFADAVAQALDRAEGAALSRAWRSTSALRTH